MKVLLTGGSGFLGTHTHASLRAAGHAVVAPSHQDVDWTCSQQLLNDVPDAIVHLAATCGGIEANRRRPGTFCRDNMLMGINVLDAARRAKVKRVVLIGTVCSYPKHCPTPFAERDLWNGYPEETNAPYGVAKRALFTMAEAYREEFGLDPVCLLPANLYGPGDNFDPTTSHVIPALIQKFTEAQRFGRSPVTLWGDGSATREFLFVEDAADAIVRAACNCHACFGPMNLGTGQEISIRDLAETVAALVGYHGPVVWDTSRPNGQPRRVLDTTRARGLLNWKATTGLEYGLRKTIEWHVAMLRGDT